jgi:hypothetical protein
MKKLSLIDWAFLQMERLVTVLDHIPMAALTAAVKRLAQRRQFFVFG